MQIFRNYLSVPFLPALELELIQKDEEDEGGLRLPQDMSGSEGKAAGRVCICHPLMWPLLHQNDDDATV